MTEARTTAETAKTGKDSIGVVLAGGGARGAYEAGALATLLPVLEQHGQRPTVFVGTSAGAINAALFASFAHLPAAQAAERALALWRSVGRAQVIKPILPSGIRAGLHYLAQLAGLRARLTGILDTSPLRHTIDTLLDWPQLHANTQDSEQLSAVAVVATTSAGRSAVFVQGRATRNLPPRDDNRAMDYISTALTTDHIMASAAIPVIFSAVEVHCPDTHRGWYLDGGIRLNAPIKPAVALGVDRTIIVAADPLSDPGTHGPDTGRSPDIYAAAAEVLRAALVDRMVEDVRTLGKINDMLHNHEHHHARRAAQGRRSYRQIPYLFVGPTLPGHLGKLAEAVYKKHYGRGRWLLRAPDFTVLHQLVGGSAKMRGELLSFLFFEHNFIEAAIQMGQHDAQRLLAQTPGEIPWSLSD